MLPFFRSRAPWTITSLFVTRNLSKDIIIFTMTSLFQEIANHSWCKIACWETRDEQKSFRDTYWTHGKRPHTWKWWPHQQVSWRSPAATVFKHCHIWSVLDGPKARKETGQRNGEKLNWNHGIWFLCSLFTAGLDKCRHLLNPWFSYVSIPSSQNVVSWVTWSTEFNFFFWWSLSLEN